MAKPVEPADASLSAQRLAYAHIRERIRAGTLAGGERVVPEAIAAELSISRMPVREAIRQLDSEGLLTIRPNRGAIVTTLTPEDVLELFEMRAVLEGLAARRAAVLMDEDTEDQLVLILRRMRRATGTSVDAFIEQHNAFHEAIGARGGGTWLSAENKRLAAAVEPYLRLYFTHLEKAQFTIEEHVALLDVLLTRNPDRAELAMREHVLSTAPDLVHVLRMTGEAH
jgi:DNA-binding GntR family transcriptional regulator